MRDRNDHPWQRHLGSPCGSLTTQLTEVPVMGGCGGWCVTVLQVARFPALCSGPCECSYCCRCELLSRRSV